MRIPMFLGIRSQCYPLALDYILEFVSLSLLTAFTLLSKHVNYPITQYPQQWFPELEVNIFSDALTNPGWATLFFLLFISGSSIL